MRSCVLSKKRQNKGIDYETCFISDRDCHTNNKGGKKKRKTNHMNKEPLPSNLMEDQSTIKKIGGQSASNKSGVHCSTKNTGVLRGTYGLGDPSSTQQIGTLEFGDQGDDKDMYDEYVLDLDQGDPDTDELFND
ncbi:hypothetical protein NDU88_004098 [Pleurodeles waltl]|uniref:Uncharacterized protein n=1 Tax=Pleurodeles waltl TaxID=8319 RepID=A0AAV7TRK4_PLEWA|nr:hypothetical protein NDU88_004098 [Pleurodeles waltl]